MPANRFFVPTGQHSVQGEHPWFAHRHMKLRYVYAIIDERFVRYHEDGTAGEPHLAISFCEQGIEDGTLEEWTFSPFDCEVPDP